jgi:hypothetical protein
MYCFTTEVEKGTKGRGRGDYCNGSLAVKKESVLKPARPTLMGFGHDLYT